MALKVRVVGVGDAFTARYYNACLLVESANTRLLIDAPPALARALRDLGERGGETVSLDDVDSVLITHLHGDHCGGLEQLLFWRRFVTQRKCSVYAIAPVLAGLWEGRLRGGMDVLLDGEGARHPLRLEDYATLVTLGAEGPTEIGDLSIAWRETVHHIPTSALKITHRGATFGYSADTSFDPSLIAWLAESALFFHETNLGIHTPLGALESLDAATRAKVRLIHYPDFHDPAQTSMATAREGDAYTV
ncbi:MAG: ribonuclease Z [Myxococcales bacterium]|nr:ribonuclease Z [Myxococcales bacterium]